MRNIFLFSLSLTIVGGCGPQPDQRAAGSDLQRDLTLVSRPPDRAVTSPERVVASSLELGEVRPQPRPSVSHTKAISQRKVVRRPGPRLAVKAALPVRPTTIERPTIADVVAPNPGAQPLAAVPADSRELPPGKTVTVIPISSGPSPWGEHCAEDIRAAGTRWRVRGGGSGMGGGCNPARGIGVPELGGSPRPRGRPH